MTTSQPWMFSALLLLIVGFLLCTSVGCSSNKACSSWTQGGGLLEIKQCGDNIDREVDCTTKGKTTTCQCKADGKPGKSFKRQDPLPTVKGDTAALELINKECAWDITW